MKWLNPPKEELPDDFQMPVWDHLDELRERVLVGALAAGVAVLTCFCFSKDLVVFLEAPVITQVWLVLGASCASIRRVYHCTDHGAASLHANSTACF